MAVFFIGAPKARENLRNKCIGYPRNEATLESMLNRIIETWKKTDFRLVKDQSKDTFIITGTEEIQILLEESQVIMGFLG